MDNNPKQIHGYKIIDELGTGSYGIVYKVIKKSKTSTDNDNNIYVIKQIPLYGLTPSEIKEVKTEANILSEIKSIYVVKFFDSFVEDNNLNIVMEYCDGGDLEQLINDKKKFPLDEDLIWKIFIQITLGLTAIHNLKILHRDLKTSNIFLTKDLNVKIGDMGVAKKLSRGNFAKTIIGTPYYLSPEICEEKPYNEKSDVWTLGCILYELCTFNHPFNAKSQGALVLKILNGTPAPIRKNYSENLQKLINLILEKNLYKRPSCKTILKLPYVIEKIKKFGMIEQCEKVGIKIKNIYKKVNIKKEKISINDDNHLLKNKTKNIKINNYYTTFIDNSNTSTNNNTNNKNHLKKKDNPWATDYNHFKKDIKNEVYNKLQKKYYSSNNSKKLSYDKVKKINLSKNEINNKDISKVISFRKDKKEKIIKRIDRSPDISRSNKKNNIKINKENNQNKEIKKNLFNNNNKSNKKIKKEQICVKIDLTNTLELNQIINNYLDKGENLRESKNLEDIKEFANNLNSYFSNDFNNKEKSTIKLINKDNNIEQDETIDSNNQETNNNSTNKNHENILNYDLERLSSNKMGINSLDELINDFTSRRPTISNNNNDNNNMNNNNNNMNNNNNNMNNNNNNNMTNNDNNNMNNNNNNNDNNNNKTNNNNNDNNNNNMTNNNNSMTNNNNNMSNNNNNMTNNNNNMTNININDNNYNNNNNDNMISRETCFHVFDNKSNNIDILNKDNNICESDDEKVNNIDLNLNHIEEEENSDNDSGEETVVTIMDNEENKNKSNIKNIQDEKERIMEDKKLLSDRLENVKKDMFDLIGEQDYKYVMELYSIIDKTKIDEIYYKIEEFAQKYNEEKKDKFDALYIKLISTDYQIQQKTKDLQQLLFNEF